MIILYSVPSFPKDISPTELYAEELYAQAKKAYVKPNCDETINYLVQYLEIGTPNEQRLESIYAVRNWCTQYLSDGVIMFRAFGEVMSTDTVLTQVQVTEQGKELLKAKPQLH